MNIRKIFRVSLLSLLGILILLGGLIYFQKDKIIHKVISELGQSFEIEIAYEDASLQLFRNLPDISFSLDQVLVQYEADTLATLHEFAVGVDLASILWKDKYELNSLWIDQLDVQLRCTDSISCNFPSFSSSEEESASDQDLAIELQNVEVRQLNISYDDYYLSEHYAIQNLSFELDGNIQNDILSLALRQKEGSINIRQSGITYADAWALQTQGDIQYHLNTGKIEINDLQGQLNELAWVLSLMLSSKGDQYELNTDLHLAESSLKPILSLIPTYYTKEYENIQTAGTIHLQLNAKGLLKVEEDAYPSIKMKLDLKDGSIKYPGLATELHDMNASFQLDKEQGSLDLLVARLEQLDAAIGESSSIKGAFVAQKLQSTPQLQGTFNTLLQLEEVYGAIPMTDIKRMEGTIRAEGQFDLEGLSETITSSDMNQFDIELESSDLLFAYDSYLPIEIEQLKGLVNEERVDISANRIRSGNTDLSSLGFSSTNGLFQGSNEFPQYKLSVVGSQVAVSEWMPSEEESEDEAFQDYVSIPKLELQWDLDLNELTYDAYTLKDMIAKGVYSPESLTIENIQVRYEGSAFSGSGEFTELESYINGKGPLKGRLDLAGGRLDLDDLMGTEDPVVSSEAETKAARFPSDIQLDMGLQLQGIQYGDIQLDQINGEAQLKEGTLTIPNAKAKSFGGDVALEGRYIAKENEPLFFDFQLAGDQFSYSSISQSLPAIREIAPLIDYIQGSLDTRLSFTGELTEDYEPVYNQLSAQGYLETFNGLIKGHPAFKKLNAFFQKPFLEAIPLEDTRNWVTIKEGVFIVEPFMTNIRNERWQVQGQHELEGKMDYRLEGPMSVEQLRGSKMGDAILSEASSILRKIPLNIDYEIKKVDVIIELKGTTAQPDFAVRLSPKYKQQLESRIQEEISGIKKAVNDSLEQVKTDLSNELNEEQKKLKENLKQEAKSKVKEIITGQKDSTKVSSVDSLKKAADEKAKEIKKKLKKWNPFKNKN